MSHLEKAYPTRSGPLPVLRDLNLEMQRGDALAVVGAAGSGQRTPLRIPGTPDPVS
ncbi:ABC transporter ATP-binding protein, partial [Lacticaseibacillus rhamnosus]